MLIATVAERPDLAARTAEIGSVWPEFIEHDAVVTRYWSRLHSELADFQLIVYDDEHDRVIGEGRTIPFHLSAGLPEGLDDVLTRGFEDGDRPTALSALVAIVQPSEQGHGLSRLLLERMGRLAAEHRLRAFVAPVRPTLKQRYPLTPMARYISWTRADGLPFDPWMRVHARLGAVIERVCERSMTIAGTVVEWETWTGLAFPESGEYVVDGALVPVRIDRETDRGLYVEPNVWMRHPV